MARKNNNKYSLSIVLFLMAALVVVKWWQRSHRNTPAPKTKTEEVTRTDDKERKDPKEERGLDRNAKDLFFTKHARCRMKCRHITQEEVKEILESGEINYRKSELDAPQGPKYAVEGYSHEKQHIRCIFAPNTQHLTVVTVIDLDEDWECPSCN
jgi:hypothetical protein